MSIASFLADQPNTPADRARFLASRNPITYAELLEVARRGDPADLRRLIEAVVKLKGWYDEVRGQHGWPAHRADLGASGEEALLGLQCWLHGDGPRD